MKTKTLNPRTGTTVKMERVDPSTEKDPMMELNEKIDMLCEAMGQLLQLVQNLKNIPDAGEE